MANEPLNELTFAARLSAHVAVRVRSKRDRGETVLVASAEIEEKQVDSAGRIRRCDLRLNSPSGRKLVSGELKRPEVSEGRDPRSENLIHDARRKAIARGLSHYFTCNMAYAVLFAVADDPAGRDRELFAIQLAPISTSGQADPYRDQIEANWNVFLDRTEEILQQVIFSRPRVTTEDVVAIRDAIFAVTAEALPRAVRRLAGDAPYASAKALEAVNSFNFPAALDPRFPDRLHEEANQMLRLGAFVVTQKLILYRVLEDSGARCAEPFRLDPIEVPATSTDPPAIHSIFDRSFALARSRSGDYETAFSPEPLVDLLFTEPEGVEEADECLVGAVWNNLLQSVRAVSWVSISQNIIGLLYEVIVDEKFRHQLGQFYTPEDVVELLVTFALPRQALIALDPASGGGSFLRIAYQRKRALGETHEQALASLWGFEITAFAAELSTITLATSDTREPAAYPRVVLNDFFDVSPGAATPLEIPGHRGRLKVPSQIDAVIGNPPYISYRRITNQTKIVNALAHAPAGISLPKFSGKTDAYGWFLVHSTSFLREGGRLAFVVSSALLFSDYGIPIVQFLAKHYKIVAVIDSIVERWFPDADTNTVLLLLERCSDVGVREANQIRFTRLKRPLAQLLAAPGSDDRRGSAEELLYDIVEATPVAADPRMSVNLVKQGQDGGLDLATGETDGGEDDE